MYRDDAAVQSATGMSARPSLSTAESFWQPYHNAWLTVCNHAEYLAGYEVMCELLLPWNCSMAGSTET